MLTRRVRNTRNRSTNPCLTRHIHYTPPLPVLPVALGLHNPHHLPHKPHRRRQVYGHHLLLHLIIQRLHTLISVYNASHVDQYINTPTKGVFVCLDDEGGRGRGGEVGLVEGEVGVLEP